MFIFLFYFLLNMKFTFSTVIIQNTGVYEIKYDDIAMIFYITVENSFDHSIHVAVDYVKCIEGDPFSDTADHMFLLGGDMGYMDKKSIRNLTLIYPNLFLRNRVGKCLVSLRYETDKTIEEMRTEIFFESAKCWKEPDPNQDQKKVDYIETNEYSGIDCVVKYSSKRSYFNRETRSCQKVPECPPNTVYIPKSNTCRKLHVPVCKSDLEMIEDGYFERSHSVSNLVNFFCHHGLVVNNTGDCACDEGWTTSTCSEGVYHPTVNLYHMCNIEINSWERANREKLFMTILVLVILALALAAKMLLALCILNWCCEFLKSRKKSDNDEDYVDSYCGDEECVPEENDRSSSRIIRVSFTNMDGSSNADDCQSDVTVSVEPDTPTTQSSVRICQCKEEMR